MKKEPQKDEIEKIMDEFEKKFISNKKEDEEYYRVWLRDGKIKEFINESLLAYGKQCEERGKEEIRKRCDEIATDAIDWYMSAIKNPFELPKQDKEYLLFEEAIKGKKERSKENNMQIKKETLKAWAKITIKDTHEYKAGEVIEIGLFRRVLMMHKGKNERVVAIEYQIIRHPMIKSVK